MTTKKFILAIDQGTTSSRAIIFSDSYEPLIIVQQEFTQHYPQDGWVEHDPKELWKVTRLVCQLALKKANKQGIQVSAIGITNQRETTVIWDKDTGKPIYNAIVWQDRRTASYCNELKNDGFERTVQQRTGLLLDPYFSASKINWILDNVDGARRKAEHGKLAFGTIDSFLIWKLTDGKVHATDATNASRTALFDIHAQAWDPELLEIFDVPRSLLPEVKNSADEFGEASEKLLGYAIPILGVAGDQHAATIGQACFEPGMIKSTYGTGCFVMLNTGHEVIESNHRLLSTVAYRLDGQPTYALEGSIFMAGAAIQWLRDGIKLIDNAKQTESIAQQQSGNRGVYMVPAFTGLGAPYWDPDARGGIFGLTRDTGPEEIIRATLEAVCYQTSDLLEAMSDDGQDITTLRVDGGMVNNNWIMQYLADILNVPVQRPKVTETTAAGVAMLAALSLGWHDSIEDITGYWTLEKSFTPKMDNPSRQALLAGWQKAVARIRENR